VGFYILRAELMAVEDFWRKFCETSEEFAISIFRVQDYLSPEEDGQNIIRSPCIYK